MARKAFVALIASVLSGAYWLLFFYFAESYTAADYRPGTEPSEGFLRAKVAVVVLGGPLLYALLILLWQRTTSSLTGSRDGRG
jgi:hypothetical protein